MKKPFVTPTTRNYYIGQVVGAGFLLTLLLALLIAIGLILAYWVSKEQNAEIQTRSDIERLTSQLESLAVQRSEALRRYLEAGDEHYLTDYQTYKATYAEVYAQILPLLRTQTEAQSLEPVLAAELRLDKKDEELIRLYHDFPKAAYFLWTGEGVAARDALVDRLGEFRAVQLATSQAITSNARRIEQVTINIVIFFVVLALALGITASLFITRSITLPISELVKKTIAIGSDLTTRVDPSGPREIAFLGETINQMAGNLFTSQAELERRKERMERELRQAGQIQANFLPDHVPELPGWEVAVFWRSARELSGDFYTYINLGQGAWGIAVGDVHGKGAPAAMAASLAVGLLEAHAPAYQQPEVLLADLNQNLSDRFHGGSMNVACCYLILQEATSQITVANAGFIAPYLRLRRAVGNGNSVSEVDVVGMPLGAWPNFDYHSQSITLAAGDLLVLASDGLVEAQNETRELFGFERLERELNELPADVNARATVNHLVDTVEAFSGNTEQLDDLTVVALRVLDPR